jgi:nitrogen fixation protein FixH
MMRQTSAKPLTGRKVLIIFLAFFGIVTAVNLVFIYYATGTFPGLVVKNSYVASQEYDAKRDAQNALGWRAGAGLEDGVLTVAIRDRNDAPVYGLTVSAVIGRPSTTAGERVIDLHPDGDVYVAHPGLPEGVWRVEIRAQGGPDETFRAIARLLQPGEEG